MMTKQDVYNSILAVAQECIQLNGYNAFSYRDISNVVGVKTSSIHYHFPTKEDLGQAVVNRHAADVAQALQSVAALAGDDGVQAVAQFFDTLFELTFHSKHKMCLGGMLASDVLTLPLSIQQVLCSFFSMIEAWLTEVLQAGVKNRQFPSSFDCQCRAKVIVSMLEGALLMARLYQDEGRLVAVKTEVLRQLRGEDWE